MTKKDSLIARYSAITGEKPEENASTMAILNAIEEMIVGKVDTESTFNERFAEVVEFMGPSRPERSYKEMISIVEAELGISDTDGVPLLERIEGIYEKWGEPMGEGTRKWKIISDDGGTSMPCLFMLTTKPYLQFVESAIGHENYRDVVVMLSEKEK